MWIGPIEVVDMKQRKQCGFALPFTVFALVVVGVITTGGFFMARLEGRMGVASETAGLAVYLTERGSVDLISDWDLDLFEALPLWDDTVVTQNYAGLGRVTARVTRMTDFLYFVDVNATVTNADTDEPISDATLTLTEGDYTETMMELSEGNYAGAGERAGTYTLTVEADGFGTQTIEDIFVDADECHVTPVTQDISLIPG